MTSQRSSGVCGLYKLEERSIDENGDERGGQGGVVNVGADDVGMQGDLRENKGKLADLREANAHAKRCLRGITEQADDCEPNREFADQDQRHYHDE